MKEEIKHIGNVLALCDRKKSANLREDLGYSRYAKLGIEERFRDQLPYRICKKCLAKIFQKENYFNEKYKNRHWSWYRKSRSQ